ncbi:hypothetical protein GCM10009433_00380 [Psychroflexus lacisalsi]|uniref:3-keto-disaccharide hydrolase domain-containing protein n=1 Tax=Psychroflexus lacisalsi TaxID=503928 RepID=A0ABN1K037_9FLAO
MKKLKIVFILFVCTNMLFSQESSEFRFHDDFRLGDFKKGWKKEITKNNGYRIDSITKEGRFNDNYLIIQSQLGLTQCLKGPSIVLNCTTL